MLIIYIVVCCIIGLIETSQQPVLNEDNPIYTSLCFVGCAILAPLILIHWIVKLFAWIGRNW